MSILTPLTQVAHPISRCIMALSNCFASDLFPVVNVRRSASCNTSNCVSIQVRGTSQVCLFGGPGILPSDIGCSKVVSRRVVICCCWRVGSDDVACVSLLTL